MNSHFSESNIYLTDISNFDTANFLSRLKQEKANGVIVIGGPPCQPFSKNGYWVKNENRKAFEDPRNMIQQFFRVISEVKPDGFLLENVESILHPSNQAAINYIESTVSDFGYNYKIFRVNAADFGVPQRRKRVFVVASRRKLNGAEPIRTHCDTEDKDILRLLPKHIGVRDFIQKYSGIEHFEKEEVANHGTYYEYLIKVPPGKNYMSLIDESTGQPRYRTGQRFWNFLLKLHPEKTSWTIPAQPGPWVGPFHWTNRRLRVPEIAAIQTFPDGYHFYGNRRSIQKQIGNAVPPLLAKAMVELLIKTL